MSTGLVYDDRFLDHDTGPGHPERPDRLRAIVAALKTQELWDQLTPVAFQSADPDAILRVHDADYIQRLQQACQNDQPFIDTVDSPIGAESERIALLAVGGVIAAADAVMKAEVRNVFCVVRPPGHHAERDRSMGFCLYNHIAIAAEHLIHAHQLSRVAIVDFDVHHGNGTQHAFEDHSDVLFVSLHQHPRTLYPGTGFEHETGVGAGVGATLNIPLFPGADDAVYQHAFETQVRPALEAFRPQCLLVSAGFDAAQADPLAQMNVTTHGFAWMSRVLVEAANRLCDGRLVSTLEGGYNLAALSAGASAHVGALIDAG